MQIPLIFGTYQLSSDPAGIPKTGLTFLKHRVELLHADQPDLAWLSELTILESKMLPLFAGDIVEVAVAIANVGFREHVKRRRGTLIVRYGPHDVGKLIIHDTV